MNSDSQIFPKKIYFVSDGTTAILKEEPVVIKSATKQKASPSIAVYTYLDGYYFKGKDVELTDTHIRKLIGQGLIKNMDDLEENKG